MDYNKIDTILESYFNGLTTLEEEKLLKNYFASNSVRPEHTSYKPIFDLYKKEQEVTNPKPIRYNIRKQKKNYKLAVAAVLIIGFGLFGLFKHQKLQDIQTASKNNKKEIYNEMKKYSNHINEGLKNMSALSIFGQSTRKIFIVDKNDTIHKKNKKNKH